jgi:hypothetical protein
MKTAELTGIELDYWTAKADGRTVKYVEAGERLNGVKVDNRIVAALTPGYDDWWQPFHVYPGSIWPIIERLDIVVWKYLHVDRPYAPETRFSAKRMGDSHAASEPEAFGPTRLIAIARCAVFATFGDTVPDGPVPS